MNDIGNTNYHIVNYSKYKTHNTVVEGWNMKITNNQKDERRSQIITNNILKRRESLLKYTN